jgi:tRNA modification GTPase
MSDTSKSPRPETIVAIATPPGEGAVGIVRLSGPSANTMAKEMFSGGGELVPYRLTLGHLRHPETGRAIDEVMTVFMPGPKSYTGEDTIEFHAHGGRVVLARILEAAVAGGARPAAPGEFTRRAFLNGRLDLSQAEAVIDLIRSRSAAAQEAALEQLRGGLSRAVGELRDSLGDAAAELEASIEFGEEEDLERMSSGERLGQAAEGIRTLLEGERGTRILQRGLEVVLTGRTNVGKSSIINMLDNSSRSIVTPSPGTTRDTIDIPLVLEGISLLLVDTAGFGSPKDEAEEEGIRRSMEKLSAGDANLVVLDSSEPLHESDRRLLRKTDDRPSLVILNKRDLESRTSVDEVRSLSGKRTVVEMSAKTGEGLEGLRRALAGCLRELASEEGGESSILINARHADALRRALAALERARENVALGGALDMLAADLREALAALGEITGQTVTDDVLDRIFSSFCIGK